MKKIFFYGNIFVEDKSHGITKKVFSEIHTLKNMGYKVYYSGYTSEGVSIFDNDGNPIMNDNYLLASGKTNRYKRRKKLLNLSKKFIKETKVTFKYAYLRFHYFDNVFLNLLRELKKADIKVIVEAHSYPYRSKKLKKSTPIIILDMIYEPFMKKYIDLVAAISNHDSIWGCKTVQIDNAIDLDLVPLQKKEDSPDKSLRLISVSNEQEYHGYKKLIRGLYKYYSNKGKRKIEILFVGEYKESTISLVSELNLEDNIKFLGKKSGDELISIYNNVDLGIGALASRAGAEYGSSIKTKEYFALGLPFINGWKEYAFSDSYPYVKRFDLDNNIIEMEEVLSFYDSIKDDKEMQIKMRQFAKEHYTWEAQFNKIFESLN